MVEGRDIMELDVIFEIIINLLYIFGGKAED